MKEIKQVNGKLNDKTSRIHRLEYLILIKCPYYPNCLWIQWNSHQNFNDILYRNKGNNPKISIEWKETPNSQSNLDHAEQSERYDTLISKYITKLSNKAV